MPEVQLISPGLVGELVKKAKTAPRRRVNHNFHASLGENPNRFLNVMLKDAYFTPHRHANPPKPESFLVLEGSVACVIFENTGEIRAVHRLGAGANYGVDVGAGIWHTIIVLSDTAVCYEVKPGPYIVTNDKEFAPWAPAEGSDGCAEYWRQLTAAALQKISEN